MRQTRGYSRTPLERHGNSTTRWEPSSRRIPTPSFKVHSDEPDCAIIVTKRRGFGSTGNTESQTMSLRGTETILQSFPSDRFYRYRIRVYLKHQKEDRYGRT